MFGGKLRPEKFVRKHLFPKQVKSHARFNSLVGGPEIELERERNLFYQTEEQLKMKREEYEKQRILMDQKWEEIASNGLKLQENFVNFNQFVQENLAKRRRAVTHFEANKSLAKKWEIRIREIKDNLGKVIGYVQELEREIQQHVMYEFQKYLESVLNVVDKVEDFKNVPNIIKRYEHYVELSNQLAIKQENTFKILQYAKTTLNKVYESNEEALLSLHTRAAGLQGRYEDALRRSHRLEALVRRIKDNGRLRHQDFENTRTGILNLYKMMCKEKGHPSKITEDDFEQHLIYIAKTLRMYKNLNSDVAKIVKKRLSVKKDK